MRASQDSVNVRGGTTPTVLLIRAIAHKEPVPHKRTKAGHGCNSPFDEEACDTLPVCLDHRPRRAALRVPSSPGGALARVWKRAVAQRARPMWSMLRRAAEVRGGVIRGRT